MIPVLLERVKIRGQDEVFLAFRIDREARTADLAPIGAEGPVLRAVSFDELEPDEPANGAASPR